MEGLGRVLVLSWTGLCGMLIAAVPRHQSHGSFRSTFTSKAQYYSFIRSQDVSCHSAVMAWLHTPSTMSGTAAMPALVPSELMLPLVLHFGKNGTPAPFRIRKSKNHVTPGGTDMHQGREGERLPILHARSTDLKNSCVENAAV